MIVIICYNLTINDNDATLDANDAASDLTLDAIDLILEANDLSLDASNLNLVDIDSTVDTKDSNHDEIDLIVEATDLTSKDNNLTPNNDDLLLDNEGLILDDNELKLIHEYSTTINVSELNFLIQQPPCPSTELDLLILVSSAPNNFRQRQAVRRQWANQEENSKFGNFLVYFMLGTVDTTTKQDEIIQENNKFQDIIQASFYDHYRNLTYKHVASFKWLKDYCNHTKLYMKVDDDVLLNTPYILTSIRGGKFFESLQDANKDFIFGRYLGDSEITRDANSKWNVPQNLMPGTFYPEYCGGFAIFYAPQTALKLLEEVKNVKYFFVEDVYATGFLRLRIGVNVTGFHTVWNTNFGEIKALADGVDRNVNNFFVGPPDFDIIKDGDALWKGVQNLNKKYAWYWSVIFKGFIKDLQ